MIQNYIIIYLAGLHVPQNGSFFESANFKKKGFSA